MVKRFNVGNSCKTLRKVLSAFFLIGVVTIHYTTNVKAQDVDNIDVYVSPPEIMEYNLGGQYNPVTETFSGLNPLNTSWAPLPNGYVSVIGIYYQTAGNSQVQVDDNYGAGTEDYMSIGRDGVVTLELNESTRYFGFAWPAGDNGNEVEVRRNGVSLFTLVTSDIVEFLPNDNTTRTTIKGETFETSDYYGKPAPPGQDQNSGEPYAYIHFIASEGLSFDEIIFRHVSGGRFETDNHTITNLVPEVGVVPELIEVYTQTPPEANDDESFGNQAGNPVTINVSENDTDGSRDGQAIEVQTIPVDPSTIVFTGELPDGSIASNNDQTLTVPGEGVWDADTQGFVTFTPDPDFVGDPTPVQYRISDVSGLASNIATITVQYIATLTLTADSGWRTLSSPVAGQTYREFFEGFGGNGLWTQGKAIIGARHDGGFPNVYTLDENGNDWEAIQNLTEPIPAGSGFLMMVYTDDDYGVTGSWNKTAAFDAVENQAPLTVNLPNISGVGDDGYNILGNPFKNRISFDRLNKNDITGTLWVYDQNQSNWISWNGNIGDVTEGIIDPFQGFIVRNVESASNPFVEFTQESKAAGPGKGFVGKAQEIGLKYIRLGVEGEGLYNSVWLQFSENGNTTQVADDALKLRSLDSNTATLSSVKKDETLLDIGHFPLPDEKSAIPIQFSATKSGSFILSFTDVNLTPGTELYLHDLQTGMKTLIAENAQYTFMLNRVNKQIENNGYLNFPTKAVSTGETRFAVTAEAPGSQELPSAVTLGQNYPNPFNPTTIISYQLPESSHVTLDVFDMSGRRVANLVEGQVQAGSHQIIFDGSNLSSGVYVYRLQAGSTVLSKKLTLIK